MNTIEIQELDAEGNVLNTKVVTLPLEPDIVVVPAEIQMWQARAILIRMGLLDTINQAIESVNDPEIKNAWEYAPNVVRRSAFVNAIAGAIGLNDEELDTIFIEAAKIK